MAEAAMKVPMNAFAQVIETVLRTNSKQAIKYLSEKLVVKATRKGYKVYNKGPQRAGSRQETFLVTFGRPNYKEREFIAQAVKVGEPFPMKRVQLRGFPGRKP